MSDLKYKTSKELEAIIAGCERTIGVLRWKINNQEIRMDVAKKYYEEKTPRLMTLEEIEAQLGYKVTVT
tara:strand:+ start:2349 stop:2555 length:207 start_codon:yes stop_codon:yes gene_type:complete